MDVNLEEFNTSGELEEFVNEFRINEDEILYRLELPNQNRYLLIWY